MVKVRVALDRVGQVRAERGVGRLVGQQVVLARAWECRKLVEAGELRPADPSALERIALAYELEQGVQALQAIPMVHCAEAYARER
jgi:hypothetical protein